jgi:uncharacterized membrane protein HdeD (DUF308 family)
MLAFMARNWWVLLIRGILAIAFGVLAFLWPGLALASLVLLFGAYALLDGVASIVIGLTGRGVQENRLWLILGGVFGVLVGVLTFVWPGITELALVYFIAAWAIITGVFSVVAAVQLRKEIENEWLLGIAGAVSVLAGLYMAAFPGAGALALIWLIAAYAIVFGVLMIGLALRLRGMATADMTGTASTSGTTGTTPSV